MHTENCILAFMSTWLPKIPRDLCLEGTCKHLWEDFLKPLHLFRRYYSFESISLNYKWTLKKWGRLCRPRWQSSFCRLSIAIPSGLPFVPSFRRVLLTFNVHMNHLRILLKFWRLGVKAEILYLSQAPCCCWVLEMWLLVRREMAKVDRRVWNLSSKTRRQNTFKKIFFPNDYMLTRQHIDIFDW